MRALGEKAFQPLFRLRHCIRLRDADRVEAERLRLLAQRSFDFLRLAQKSRSA